MSSSNIVAINKSVDALVDYTLDIKPYHTKLSSVIEQYLFNDTISVSLNDKHFLKIHLNSNWVNSFISDGTRRQFMLPFRVKERWFSQINSDTYTVGSDEAGAFPGLNFGSYSLKRMSWNGITGVMKNTSYQVESIDYHVSRGACLVDVLPGNQFVYTNLKNTPNSSFSSSLNYRTVTTPFAKVKNVIGNSAATTYDEYTLTVNNIATSTKESSWIWEDEITVAGIISLTHNLDSKDVFISAWKQVTTTQWSRQTPDIEFIDDDTIDVDLSTGTWKIIVSRIFNNISWAESWNQGTNTATWLLYHNLNASDVLVSLKQISTTETVLWDSAITSNGPLAVAINHSSSINCRATLWKLTPDYGIVVTATSNIVELPDTFSNEICHIYGIKSDGSTVYPTSIVTDTLGNPDALTVTFPVGFTGKVYAVRDLADSSNSTTCEVKGKLTGDLGIASFNATFNHSNISFFIEQLDDADVGSTILLSPNRRLVTHPTAPQETWSIIKTNPEALEKSPVFRSPSRGQLSDVTLELNAIQQVWKITAISPTQFSVVGSVTGSAGIATVGTHYSNAQIGFLITSISGGIVVGDRFEINVVNKNATVENIEVVFYLGYDVVNYDAFNYDGRTVRYPTDQLNIQLSTDLPHGAFIEVVKTSTSDFSVIRYTSVDDRTVQQTYAPAQLGVPYSNSDFSFTIIDVGTPFLEGDTISFSVNNPDPYIEDDPFYKDLIPLLGPFLNLYASSFSSATVGVWKMVFDDINTISVFTNNSLRLLANLQDGDSNKIENECHWTIIRSYAQVNSNDYFHWTIKQIQPTYSVFGSISGWQDSAVVGEWYWNGKIGFKIPKLSYNIVSTKEYVFPPFNRKNPFQAVISVGTNVYGEYALDENNFTIVGINPITSTETEIADFQLIDDPNYEDNTLLNVGNGLLKPLEIDGVVEPRFDARPQQYTIKFINASQAIVWNNMRGWLQPLVVDNEWSDGIVRFVVERGSKDFVLGDMFRLDIRPREEKAWTVVRESYDVEPYDANGYDMPAPSTFYLDDDEIQNAGTAMWSIFPVNDERLPLYAGFNAVFWKNGLTVGDVLKINKTLSDRLSIRLNTNKGRSLGVEDNGWLPLIVENRDTVDSIAHFSDLVQLSSVKLAATGREIAVISSPMSDNLEGGKQKIDSTMITFNKDWFDEFLPFNTPFAIKIDQDVGYSDIVEVHIAEFLHTKDKSVLYHGEIVQSKTANQAEKRGTKIQDALVVAQYDWNGSQGALEELHLIWANGTTSLYVELEAQTYRISWMGDTVPTSIKIVPDVGSSFNVSTTVVYAPNVLSFIVPGGTGPFNIEEI